jgi:hypothetical protein
VLSAPRARAARSVPRGSTTEFWLWGLGVTPAARVLGSSRETLGTDSAEGDSFSHAAMAAGVAIMVSNSIGGKRPSEDTYNVPESEFPKGMDRRRTTSRGVAETEARPKI